MVTQHDNLAAAADGDTQHEAEQDVSSLLAESESLVEPEDASADPEEGAEEEGEEPAEAAKADGQDVGDDAKVALNGREVTVRELKETFSTFQRKTQEYAEVDTQREVQARQAIATIQEQAAQQVAAIADGIKDLVLPGIDLNAIASLRLTDPARAGELLTNLQIVEHFRQQMLTKANGLWAQAQQQKSAAEQRAAQAQSQLLASEGKKLSAQKWFTEDFQSKAVSYLKKHGVPETFASKIPYAGGIEIIRKAMMYDQAQTAIKNGKQPSQQQQIPASGKAPAASTKQRADAAFALARKTNSKQDSAKAYASLLSRGV